MAEEAKKPEEKKPTEKMVRIRYNKEVPHKIGAHRGGEDSDATVPIVLRQGLNHVPADAWERAKQLQVIQHHLTAKVIPVVREGKHVVVPLIEELGEAKPEDADAKKKAATDPKGKAEAEEAERQRAAAEAKAKEEAEAKAKLEAEKRAQQGGGQKK